MEAGENPDEVVFHSLDRDAEIDFGVRNLPHWFQPGAATFITFRSHDSLPKEVLLRWQRELEEWLLARDLPPDLADSTVNQRLPNHSQLLEKLDATSRQEFRKLSGKIFHRSLDQCHGECLLRDPMLAKLVADALLHGESVRYDLANFVVMPNHVHAIVQFRLGTDLSIVSQSWMRYSARCIHREIGRTGAFWQPEPFDHIIRSAEQFAYLQQYIADNPAKADLHPADYLYWHRPM